MRTGGTHSLRVAVRHVDRDACLYLWTRSAVLAEMAPHIVCVAVVLSRSKLITYHSGAISIIPSPFYSRLKCSTAGPFRSRTAVQSVVKPFSSFQSRFNQFRVLEMVLYSNFVLMYYSDENYMVYDLPKCESETHNTPILGH